MKRRLKFFIIIPCTLSFFSLFFGCATPKIPMQTPVKELSQIDQDHGIVVGSILVSGPKLIYGGTPHWTLNASEYKHPKSKVHAIEGVFGEEQIFVTKMPIGQYYFNKFTVYLPNVFYDHAYLDERFTIHQGETVYIGRLVIEFPGRFYIRGAEFSVRVEDAKKQTLASAEKKYGYLVPNAITELMGTGSQREADHLATLSQQFAKLYRQRRYSEAENVGKEVLEVAENLFGTNHPHVAASLSNLALVYVAQGKYAGAEQLQKRALAIDEKALGKDHPDVAVDLNNLAETYHYQGKYPEAEHLFKRSLAIKEKALGPDHAKVASMLKNMAECYREMGNKDEAEKLEAQARKIRSKQ